MPGCSAYGCTSRTNRLKMLEKPNPKITFHIFPKNPERRNAWIKAVGRKNWEPTENAYLCSLHFEESMMDRTSVNTVRLQKNAVPSIFNISPSFMKPKKRRRRNHVEEEIEIIVQSDGSVADPCTSFVPISKELNKPNTSEIIYKLKKRIASLELRRKCDLIKIKTLQQYKLRVKRRIQDLEQNSKLDRLKIKTLEQYKLRVKRKIESLKDLIDPDLDKVPKPVRRRRKPGLPRPKLVPNAQTCPSQMCPKLGEEASAITILETILEKMPESGPNAQMCPELEEEAIAISTILEKVPESGPNAQTCPSQKWPNLREEASTINADDLEQVLKPGPNAQTCSSQKCPNLEQKASSSAITANDLEKVSKPGLPRLKPVQFLGIVHLPLRRIDANLGP